MRKRRIAAALCLVAFVGGALAARSAPLEEILRPRDHQKLGGAIGKYFDALSESDKINEAFSDLQKEVQKLDKKHKKLLENESILKLVEDWEKAFYLATPYRDTGVKKGRLAEQEFEGPFAETTYAVHVPKAYSSKKGPYPLVISIPKKGQTGKAHITEQWIDGAGRGAAIIVSCNMPSNSRMWTEYGEQDNPGGVDTVMLTLGEVKKRLAVDADRIFIAGFEEGVPAASRIAALFPHVFAGLIGRAGDVDDIAATNFRNVPSFFAGGGENCTKFAAKAKEAGFENVTVESTATEADIWAWIGRQARDANPMEISFTPLHRNTTQCYWLMAMGFDVESNPSVHARIDRAANTIHIEAEGVSTVRIFFNDLLVDMSLPVKVVCNGVEREDTLPRRLKEMCETAYFSGDYGRIYTYSRPYDLPEGE